VEIFVENGIRPPIGIGIHQPKQTETTADTYNGLVKQMDENGLDVVLHALVLKG
jgi:hypothetical protein